jgi:hypothetical protein
MHPIFQYAPLWRFCDYAGDESLLEVKVLSFLMVADNQLISKGRRDIKIGGWRSETGKFSRRIT